VDVADYLDHWGLKEDRAASASAGLAFVRSGSAPAVLKLLDEKSDEANAARALRHFGGEAAVRVLREDRGAILTERAVPGTPLSSLVGNGRDDEATAIIADVISRLHHGKVPTGWPTLETWGAGFQRQKKRGTHRRLPPRLLDAGERVFLDLARSQGKQRFLLHGDLHHDNIVFDERRGWLAIDPKGVVGETAFETAAAMRNPTDLYPLQIDPMFIERRVAIFSERLNLDRERVLGWFVGQTVLSVCWLIEDRKADEAIVRGVHIAEAAQAVFEKA
jgi:streptomycin 6-kinase